MNRILLHFLACAFATMSAFAQSVTVQSQNFQNATKGANYGPFALSATGGGPLLWTLQSGQLPPSLSLNTFGIVGGTVDLAAPTGPYVFTVRATNVSSFAFGERTFTIIVVPPPTLLAGNAPLPTAIGNVFYNAVLSSFFLVNGGATPVRFEIVNNVVNGFAMNASGTALVGASRNNPNPAIITFRVVDANGAVSGPASIGIVVSSTALQFATTTLPNWTVNQPYFNAISVQNGLGFYRYAYSGTTPPGMRTVLKASCPTEPVTSTLAKNFRTTADMSGGTGPYTYQQTTNSLGASITFSQDGVLVGTGTSPGLLPYSVTVSDSNGLGLSRDCSYTIGPLDPSSLPDAACGLDYAQAGSYYNSGVVAANLTGPITYSFLSGSLPTGLVFSASGAIAGTATGAPGLYSYSYEVASGSGTASKTCSIRLFNGSTPINASALVGTPTSPGAYNFSMSVTDELSGFASQSFQVTINAAPAFNALSLPQAAVGLAYSSSNLPNSRSGGTPGFTFTLASGALPPGLALQANGQIVGTPTAPGTFSFVASVTDIAGAAANTSTQIVVSNGSSTLAITTLNAPVGVRDLIYPGNQFASAGGSGFGYSYSLASGSLPPGVTLSTNGVLFGAATQTGSFAITVRVADSANATATRLFTILITDFSCPLAFAVLGETYSNNAVLTPFGASQYSISSGAIPPGFNFNVSSGNLNGTSTTEASYSYAITATDDALRAVTRSCYLVTQSRLQLSSARTTARVGIPYFSAISASGGFGSYSFSIVAGTLPQGLTMSTNTGGIAGIPTTNGATSFRVRVQDTSNNVSQRDFSINVLSRTTAPSLRCPLPSAMVESAYRSALSINASGNLSFNITSGALPSGLTLNQTSGLISGTVLESGLFSFTARVTGALTPPPINVSCSIQAVLLPPASLKLACPDQDDLVAGEVYSTPGIASGGRFPYTYELYQSTLPSGLSLDSATGMVFGTPSQSGSQTYGLRVVDGQSYSSTTTPLCQVSIINATPLILSTTSLPTGLVSAFYSAGFSASGGLLPYYFTVNTSLPAGLTLNSSTGLISGTPLQTGTVGFTLRLADSLEAVINRDFSIAITAPDALRFSTSVVDTATVGLAYSAQLQAAGGTPPYRYAIVSGSPAPGLSFNGDGQFRGTPTTAGTFAVRIELRDSTGDRVEKNFSMSVFQGSFRLGCPNASAEQALPYLSQANVLGGTPPYAFLITSGALPGGLSLDSITGLINGRALALGSSIFSFAVTDSRQNRTQAQCSITVQGGALQILSNGPILVRAGESYAGKLDAAGGKVPYAWSLVASSSEAGFQLAREGSYTGTAMAKGSYAITILVRDAIGATASKTLQLQAGDSTLTVGCPATTRLPFGVTTIGTFPFASGVVPYQLRIIGGDLPPSFRVSGTGYSVTPISQNDFTGLFQGSDNAGTVVQRSCSFTVTAESFTISTEVVPDAALGAVYRTIIESIGGIGSVRYSLIDGALPDGLELDSATGILSGIPQRTAQLFFNVAATDELLRKATKTLSIQVNGGSLALSILPDSLLPDAVVGKPYTATFGAQGGRGPYQIDLSSSIPNAVNPIRYTPQQAGTETIFIRVRDASNTEAQKAYQLRVLPPNGLNILTESLPDALLEKAYAISLTAENGTGPYRWSIVRGSLPVGLSFDPLSGLLSGVAIANGQFAITATVFDSSGNSSRKDFTFEVRPEGVGRLEITNEALPSASVGILYSTALSARGGREPYIWTLNGDMPPGLSLNANGSIIGTPTTFGSKTLLLSVADSLGLISSKAISIAVLADAIPSLLIDGLPDTAGANQSLPFSLRMASPFGVPITGRATLTFLPDPIHNAGDSVVLFSNGTRFIDFTVAAGSSQVMIAGPSPSITTGTLAGSTRVDTILNFSGISAIGPARTVAIRRALPVITTLRLTRSAGGLEVRVEGYTSTRQLNEARVSFTTASGVDVNGSTQVTVNVQAAIQTWFASAGSLSFGGQFALTLPFTVSGSSADITGVSVVIVNSEGPSTATVAN